MLATLTTDNHFCGHGTLGSDVTTFSVRSCVFLQ